MEYCSCTNYETITNANDPQYRLLARFALHAMHLRSNAYKGSSCLPVELDVVKRVQLATAENMDERQYIMSFTTKASKTPDVGSEVFDVVFVRNNGSVLPPAPDARLKGFTIGTSWNTDKKEFDGDIGIISNDGRTIWCVNRWEATSDKDNIQYDIQWIMPRLHPDDPEQVFKLTDVDIDESWVLGWQPLIRSEPIRPGEWLLRVLHRRTRKVIAESVFFVMDDRSYDGLPLDVVGRYWTIQKIHRVTAYEPYRKCADPQYPLDTCICDRQRRIK